MITISDELLERIYDDPGSVYVRVERSADPQLAAAALGKAREGILALGAKYVSDVAPSPAGPFVWIDAVGVERLHEIPAIVARKLEEAGLESALITSPESGGRLTELAYVPKAVVLRLLTVPPPAERVELPTHWLDEACAFVTAGAASTAQALASVNFIESSIGVSDALTFVADAAGAEATSRLVVGDMRTRLSALGSTRVRLLPVWRSVSAAPPATTSSSRPLAACAKSRAG